ncbi:MAG: ChrR family anti-sigma-E factor [Pseudomonadota bacterium]
MTMPILPKHHPSDERLLDYATGAAAEPLALVIACHLALCARCRHEMRHLEQLGGALLDDAPQETMSAGCLDRLFARIELPDSRVEVEVPAPIPAINRDIPQPLRRYLDRPLSDMPWRKRGAISELELLPEVSNHATRLLWIRSGAAAPRHTHEGSEVTLVLKGSFWDGHGHYGCGDIAEADSDVDHRPIAGDDEDCLCLTVTDAPLKLTSPIGRLINPFLKI